MKKFKYLAMASVFAFGMTSCGDFDDMNIDPEHINEGNAPYEMIFTNGQHQALGSDWDMWRTGCIYSSQFVQHLVSIQWWEDYGRYIWSDGYSGSYWDTYSSDRGAMRDLTTVYDQWKDNADLAIDWNIARVMRVYAFSKMTDLYGDIPYSQAGRPKEYQYPKYDTQQEIYMSMLAELDEAQANLGSGKATMGNHDVYFQGDAAAWKKFANGLMLRLAMRLVKVDEATARQYAAKALANGLLTSNNDNAKLEHPGGVTTNDSAEPFAKINAHEDKEFLLANTFIDYLKENNDPRISLIATLVTEKDAFDLNDDGEISSYRSVQKGWNTADYGNSDPSVQRGLPVGGYSNGPSSQYFIGHDYPEFSKDKGNFVTTASGELVHFYTQFSTINRYTYCDPEAPTFILTYAQTQFLLAEAAVRNYVSGDAATYFENALRAACAQFSQFPAKGAANLMDEYLTGDAVNTFVSNMLAKFNAASTDGKLEIINSQYWVNSFGDEYESFANWRRSGYPALKASPFCAGQGAYTFADGATANADGSSASNGIPRRFRYPANESQINSANYNEAVSRMTGGDRFDSRVWWDK